MLQTRPWQDGSIVSLFLLLQAAPFQASLVSSSYFAQWLIFIEAAMVVLTNFGGSSDKRKEVIATFVRLQFTYRSHIYAWVAYQWWLARSSKMESRTDHQKTRSHVRMQTHSSTDDPRNRPIGIKRKKNPQVLEHYLPDVLPDSKLVLKYPCGSQVYDHMDWIAGVRSSKA